LLSPRVDDIPDRDILAVAVVRSSGEDPMQQLLFQRPDNTQPTLVRELTPFRTPLPKWIGDKQQLAHEIAAGFPVRFGTYVEPLCGQCCATGHPGAGTGQGIRPPETTDLEIWQTLSANPSRLEKWCTERRNLCMSREKVGARPAESGFFSALTATGDQGRSRVDCRCSRDSFSAELSLTAGDRCSSGFNGRGRGLATRSSPIDSC